MATAHTAKKQKKYSHVKNSGLLAAPHNLHERYLAAMPANKHRRHMLLAASFIVAAVIALQLAYPLDRGLPFASVGGESMRLATHETIAKAITDQFDASKLKLTVGADKTTEFALKKAGAEPNTERMIEKLNSYPLWLRLIPGSLLLQAPELREMSVFYTNQPFRDFVEAKSKELSFAPVNARLAIKDGKLVATEAKAGSNVAPDELLNAISNAVIKPGVTTTLEVPSRRIVADRTSKDLAAVQVKAEAILAHTVTLTIDGKVFSPDKAQLASWVLLTSDAKGDVTVSIDSEKVKAYLNQVNQQVASPAGQTDISIVDGREVGRVSGATGRSLDVVALTEQLAVALMKPPSSVAMTPPLVATQPSVIFNSKYSATQAGLQAFINDRARTKNMRIAIQQLNGEGWTASARANESIPSASTYKLFVSLVLFDRIDKGEIHWSDPMLDTTVAGCFERMTVASTNPCAESWIAQFGRQYINDFIHARGFSTGTSFTTGSANQTTAADLNKFMTGLNNGTLVSGANRDRLLSALGRHPYRYGIPTGSKGIVHDKVGFLWDYVHDTAIVQHPRGSYIMTIMTKGQSYAAIATITREIERIMYP